MRAEKVSICGIAEITVQCLSGESLALALEMVDPNAHMWVRGAYPFVAGPAEERK